MTLMKFWKFWIILTVVSCSTVDENTDENTLLKEEVDFEVDNYHANENYNEGNINQNFEDTNSPLNLSDNMNSAQINNSELEDEMAEAPSTESDPFISENQNLNSMTEQPTEVLNNLSNELDGNLLLQPSSPELNQNELTVESPRAEVIPPVANPVLKSEIVADDVLPTPGVLWWIGYDYKEREGLLNIKMLTKGTPQTEFLSEKEGGDARFYTVRFHQTKMRRKIRRDINSSEFRSPVSYIEMIDQPHMNAVDVVLSMREQSEPEISSYGGQVQLSFKLDPKYLIKKSAENQISSYQVEVLSDEPLVDGSSDLNTNKNVYNPDPAKGVFDKNKLMDKLPTVSKLYTGVDDSGLPAQDFGGYQVPGIPPQAPQKLDPKLDSQPANPVDSNNQESVPGKEIEGFEVRGDSKQPLYQVEEFGFFEVAQDDFGLDSAQSNTSGEIVPNFNSPALDDGGLDLGESLFSSEVSQDPILGTEVPLLPDQADIVGVNTEGASQQYNGKPIVLEFYQAPLGEVLKTFSDQVGTNFVFPADVGKQKVTIKLKKVPWDAALNAILETYRLGMSEVSANVVRIDKIERMNEYISLKDQANQARVLSQPRKILVVRLSNARADKDFKTKLEAFFKINGVDNRTSINVDERTNYVFIEAPPSILSRAKTLIERLDVPEPQVEVLSRLVEVSRRAKNFLGISWNGGLNFDPNNGLGFGSLNFPNSVGSNFSVDPAVNSASTVGAMNFNIGSINNVIDIGLRLKMEETRGTTEILQANRVLVSDRKQAEISAGTKAYFRVSQSPVFANTVEQQQDASSQDGQQSGGGTAGVAGADFTLKLTVRPEVTNDGQIKMELDINSEVPNIDGLPGADLSTSKRHLSTFLKKRSGETAVIGGIYDTRKTKVETGIPILSSLPIIGALFRSKSITEDQTELMVFITPTIKSSYAADMDNPAGAGSETTNFGDQNTYNSGVNENYNENYGDAAQQNPGDFFNGNNQNDDELYEEDDEDFDNRFDVGQGDDSDDELF